MNLFGFFNMSIPQIELYMLLFIRISTLLMILPIFDNNLVQPTYKILLAYIIAIAMFPLVAKTRLIGVYDTMGGLILAISKEIFVGLVMGFTARLIFAGIEFAAQFAGVQMGFGAANIMDPTGSQQVTVIATLQVLLMTILFLALDGHHMFFTALSQSLAKIPLGAGKLTPDLAKNMVALSGSMFEIGFRLAAPMTIVMILTNVALGVMSRFIPQLNILMVSFPITIGVGLITFGASIPYLSYAMKYLFKIMADDLAMIIALM